MLGQDPPPRPGKAQGRGDSIWCADAPATGHGAALLRVPQVVLDTVPAGPLKDDMRWMRDLLADPAQTALNYVTIPRRCRSTRPWSSTGWARARSAADPAGRLLLELLLAAALRPGRARAAPRAPAPAARGGGRGGADAASGQSLRSAGRPMRAELPLPLIELPQMFVPAFGPETVDQLALASRRRSRPPLRDGRRCGGPALKAQARELPSPIGGCWCAWVRRSRQNHPGRHRGSERGARGGGCSSAPSTRRGAWPTASPALSWAIRETQVPPRVCRGRTRADAANSSR